MTLVRRLMLVSLIAALGVACSGSGSEEAAPTSTTTTTAPDPAAKACRETHTDLATRPEEDPALDELTLSRDPRIVEAARQVEAILQDRSLDSDPVPPDLDLEYAEAVLELARACKTAGYLP